MLSSLKKRGIGLWGALVASLMGLGMVQVSQQTTIWLHAYRLGEQTRTLHDLENETFWLKAQVVGLESPVSLDRAMREKRMTFVARSTVAPTDPSTRLAHVVASVSRGSDPE